jgi:hypothetical protein
VHSVTMHGVSVVMGEGGRRRATPAGSDSDEVEP